MRGDGGFGIGNSVQYVVDGTILPNSADILLDEIEDISVLSGPAASAILGSQGANGAIIITTKDGRSLGKQGLGSRGQFGVRDIFSVFVTRIPERICRWYISKRNWTNTNGMLITILLSGNHWMGNSIMIILLPKSWGPKMEGQEYIPWYSWYPGSKYIRGPQPV